MQTTGNLGLKKPEGTDIVDIADLNGNMDILDNAVNGKVDKATGKQLSTNDYTAAEKTKLAGIAAGANNYTHPNHTGDVTSNGDGVTAIAAGAIVDADVNANAGIKFSKVNAVGSIMDSDINDEAYIDMLKIGSGRVNNDLLDQLYGVTAPIQGQLDGKLPTAGGNMSGPINMSPNGAVASSWSNIFRFQFRDAVNKIKERTLGVNTVGNLMFSVPGVMDNMVPLATNGDMIYYVRTDGSDSNTGLANTVGGAFKTVSRAIAAIPQVVNHKVIINIAAGTYAENVTISGFSGSGSIVINGAAVVSTTTHNVSSFVIDQNTARITLNGITLTTTTTYGIVVRWSTGVLLARCNIVSKSNNPGVFADSSFIQMGDTCMISNRDVAINAHVNAIIFSQSTTGTGNTIAFTANYGSKISYSGVTPGAVTLASASEGGSIIPTVGVINPWGDNTTDARPAARSVASNSVKQPLQAAIWTKILFPNKQYDMLNNYDAALHRFTAPQRGLYQINVGVVFLNPQGQPCELFLHRNGSSERRLTYQPSNSGMSASAVGSATVLLSTGDYIEIFGVCNASTELSLGNDGNLEVTRIA